MTQKHRLIITMEDVEDGTIGICLACGNTQYGAEPDAHGITCESCGEPQVMGAEEAVLLGYADLDEEDYE